MKTRRIILGIILGINASVSAHASTFTNKSYYFDSSTGNIITQLNIFANPARFSITNGYFFDQANGNFCVMISTSQPTVYLSCSNLIWLSIAGNTTNAFTNRVCQSLVSNVITTGRYFVNGSYPTTNKAAAVKTGP